METIKEIIAYIPEIIDVIGVIILIIGFIRGLIKYVQFESDRIQRKGNVVYKMQLLRCDIGMYILLALDFMITSDIINSMVHTDMQELINLAFIVVLRTVIGYFLGKELEEVHQKNK